MQCNRVDIDVPSKQKNTDIDSDVEIDKLQYAKSG